MPTTRASAIFALTLIAGTAAGPAAGQVASVRTDLLGGLAFAEERLAPPPDLVPIDEAEGALAPGDGERWAAFLAEAGGGWQGSVDRRSGLLGVAEGAGIPWVPGRGNGLRLADLTPVLGGRGQVDLAVLERIARAFLPRVAPLLGVEPTELVLHRGRSGQPADHLWFLDFEVVRGGLPIAGARVIFRVNNGNLVQLGAENLPSPGAAIPTARLSREEALLVLAEYLGGFTAADRFLDSGSLELLPVAADEGRGLALTWRFVFEREGVVGAWRGRVDAASGEILDFLDLNEYARVTGGVYPVSPAVGPEEVRGMPFADVPPIGCTDDAGVYPGGGLFSRLDGCFVKIADNCGAIQENADPFGNIAFGASAGTDCVTPSHGGGGNTHAARTQFYHVNRVKQLGRGWLPANAWLNAKLTINTNINSTCNAFWNGATLNFYRSGGGCANTGEMAEVAFHEYGHGLDANDGNGTSPDRGTGETYGDFTSALVTHNSCIGRGFTAFNCGGYGDPCLACTGVRDIDWARHAGGVPHTVANFTQPFCPASLTYRGPCGREGHCESYVSSEALWDLAARDLPGAGTAVAWMVVDRLWHLSRSTATAAFTCSTVALPWASNGCNVGSLWKTLRVVDDDDGNLANGTPHSCALFAAFNRHGIACPADPGAAVCFSGCAAPPVPVVTATVGAANQVHLTWTDSGAGVVYDLYRNDGGCDDAFFRIANDVAGLAFLDPAPNGTTFSYRVVAHRAGNESCAAAPSACVQATPCTDTTLFSQDFAAGAPGWVLGPDWRVQVCGSSLLRFGGLNCTANYANNLFSTAVPPAVAVPAGAQRTRLTFQHRWRFETGFDGGALALSFDGVTFGFVPAAAILSGVGYNGTISPACPPAGAAGTAVFTGVQGVFVPTQVDLDAACNALSGGTAGCGGGSVFPSFTGITDCSVTDDGWLVDDLAVTACVP